MRDGMDIQEAATLGNFVWIADNFRGGTVRVQQRGEIAERVGNASRILPINGDCHGAERGDVQCLSDAEGAIGAGDVHALDDAAQFQAQ
jgi:hypothetical protein